MDNLDWNDSLVVDTAKKYVDILLIAWNPHPIHIVSLHYIEHLTKTLANLRHPPYMKGTKMMTMKPLLILCNETQNEMNPLVFTKKEKPSVVSMVSPLNCTKHLLCSLAILGKKIYPN